MKTITLLLVLCISACNAQPVIDGHGDISNPNPKGLSIVGGKPTNFGTLTVDTTQYWYYKNSNLDPTLRTTWRGNMIVIEPERKERFWVNEAKITNAGIFLSPTIDSIVTLSDGNVAFYYSNTIWKERYEALLKLRKYGYFKVPIHNRKRFKKAEKEYLKLLK